MLNILARSFKPRNSTSRLFGKKSAAESAARRWRKHGSRLRLVRVLATSDRRVVGFVLVIR